MTRVAGLVETAVPTKIRFYFDASNLGGHELMTLHLLERLAGDPRHEITFVARQRNQGLCQAA